jgi:hypothetical protein
MSWVDIEKALRAPFKVNQLYWVGGVDGPYTVHINVHDVENRLDCVMGIENWQDRYEEVSGRLICYLSLRCDGEWITKSDGILEKHSGGFRTDISEAFKRAAKKFGVGKYLHYLPKDSSPTNIPRWAVPDP